jgi:8-oxo-dGTP pyrophosphatase MutT (NUDIX family)
MNQLQFVSPTIEDIRQALTSPLPGVKGQIKMAPQPRVGQINRWETPPDCREASVLLLLYPHLTNGLDAPYPSQPELHLVLTRRPEYPGAHSGQISLPGGRREAGESLQTTALREAYEEIGLVPTVVEVIGQLSPLYTPPSNFCIYPFVALSATRPDFQPDPKEVAEIIELPFSLLLNPALRKEEVWHFPNYGERHVPFFDVFGHQVWGATAMILSEFLTLLQSRSVATSPDNHAVNVAL